MTKKTQFVCTIFAMAAVSVGSVKAYSAWNEKTELPRLTVSESAASAAVSSDMNATQTTLATSAMQTPENVANLNIPEGKPLLTTEEAVEKVLPAVVGIESEFNYTQTFQNYGFLFGRSGRQSQQQVMTGTGTGVVITDDGYIVTNAHVIYDNEHGCGLAGSINVLMGDSEKIKAELVGYDVDCDLAVLKVEGNGLAHAELGNSDDLKLGQSVVAIGNPLGFDLRNTVTAGIGEKI